VLFPFCETPKDFAEAVKRRKLTRAGPEVIKILAGLKPWKGGNPLLRAIHDMDILDKHQALVPIIAGGISPAMKIAFNPAAPTDIPRVGSKITHDGQSLIVMPPVSNLPTGKELPADWAITFDSEAGPLAGCEVVESLNQLTSLTASIIQLFRTRFPGPYSSLRPSS
jgi:hypothetical protein